MHPAHDLPRWTPVARPAFGVAHPLEWLLSFGELALLPTMYLHWGADHLLVVRRSGATERYQRLYFNDIQGIRLQRSGRNSLATAVLLIAGVFLVLGAIATYSGELSGGEGGAIVWGVLGALMLALAGFNESLGPLCTVDVFTAVERVRLDGVARWRLGQRFADTLAERVRAVQGGWPATDGVPAPLGVAPVLSARRSTYGAASEAPTLKWHMVFYGLEGVGAFLGAAVLGWSAVFFEEPSDLVYVVNAFLFAALAWSGAMAVCVQQRPEFLKGLRGWTNANFVWQLFSVAVVFYMEIFFGVIDPNAVLDGSMLFRVIDVLISLLGAAVGLLLLRDHMGRVSR